LTFPQIEVLGEFEPGEIGGTRWNSVVKLDPLSSDAAEKTQNLQEGIWNKKNSLGPSSGSSEHEIQPGTIIGQPTNVQNADNIGGNSPLVSDGDLTKSFTKSLATNSNPNSPTLNSPNSAFETLESAVEASVSKLMSGARSLWSLGTAAPEEESILTQTANEEEVSKASQVGISDSGNPNLRSMAAEEPGAFSMDEMGKLPRTQPFEPLQVSEKSVFPSETTRETMPSTTHGPTTTFNFGSIDTTSGKILLQRYDDVNQLLGLAKESRGPLEQVLDEVSQEVPGADVRGVRENY
jgi:hypothetical protein